MARGKEKAKIDIIKVLSSKLSPAELAVRTADFEGYAEQARDEKDRLYWVKQVDACKKLSADESFQRGEYPQSLNKLVFDIVDSRALTNGLLKAFQLEPWLNNSHFFCMWVTGVAYHNVASFAKLASCSKNEPLSLPALWEKSSVYLVEDGIVSHAERAEINRKLALFRNHNQSTSLRYRNKAFMHNEISSHLSWEQLDQEFSVIARVWSLLTQWTGPILMPFAHKNQITNGMERFMQPTTLQQCKNEVNEYIQKFQGWCTTPLVDGVTDTHTPFGSISFELAV